MVISEVDRQRIVDELNTSPQVTPSSTLIMSLGGLALCAVFINPAVIPVAVAVMKFAGAAAVGISVGGFTYRTLRGRK